MKTRSLDAAESISYKGFTMEKSHAYKDAFTKKYNQKIYWVNIVKDCGKLQ